MSEVNPPNPDLPDDSTEDADDIPPDFDRMKTVASTYDKIADTYGNIRKRDSADQLLDFIFANVESNSNVLDVGCGTGKPVTEKLSKRYNVFAIDSSERMIEIAGENLPDSVELLNSDIRDVDFRDNNFQAVIMYYVLVNINREDHKQVLSKLYNLLDSGGYILFSTGRGNYKLKVTNNWLGSGYTMFWSFYDNDVYLDMLEDIGFEIKAGVIDAPHELKGDKKRKHPFIFAKK